MVVPGTESDGGTVMVFTDHLVEESADPVVDADSDVAEWPTTFKRLVATSGLDAIYVPGHGMSSMRHCSSPAGVVVGTCGPRARPTTGALSKRPWLCL